MTTAEALKKVKAINERLAVYERKGLTASSTYQGILNAMEIMEIPTTTSRTGTPRISRSKEALQYFTTAEGTMELEKIDKKGGLKQERERTKNKLKSTTGSTKAPTTKEIDQAIINYGKLEKWAAENLSDVYGFAKVLDEAAELEGMFDEGLRYYSYEEIFAAIDKYEEARKKYEEEMNQSDLSRATETVILQGDNKEYDQASRTYEETHKRKKGRKDL